MLRDCKAFHMIRMDTRQIRTAIEKRIKVFLTLISYI